MLLGKLKSYLVLFRFLSSCLVPEIMAGFPEKKPSFCQI